MLSVGNQGWIQNDRHFQMKEDHIQFLVIARVIARCIQKRNPDTRTQCSTEPQ